MNCIIKKAYKGYEINLLTKKEQIGWFSDLKSKDKELCCSLLNALGEN